MTVNKEISFWKTNKDWYRINKEFGRFEIKETAPKEAKESFAKWKKFYNLDY